MKSSRSVRVGQEIWMVRDLEPSDTFMLDLINGLKRLQNHVHVYVSKTKELYRVYFGKAYFGRAYFGRAYFGRL
jgi:hypothetical protein